MRSRRSPRRAPLLRYALIVAVAAVGATACQAAEAPEPLVSGPPAPSADVDAIRTTVDAVNATAGGAVADQQAQLAALVDPARRGELQNCPSATTTVRLEPVGQGLRELPAPAGRSETPTPTAGAATYALPTLIRIFSGDRLVGTDLTTLKLVVRRADNGTEAYLTPFCVN